MTEDDAQPPYPPAQAKPRKPRGSPPRPTVIVKGSRRPGRDKRPVAAAVVPKLDAQNLASLSARIVPRPKLRMHLHSLLMQAHPEVDAMSLKVLLGRFAREGRDLGQPLEFHRHHMLVYMDAVLCGRERMRADPLSASLATSPVGEMVGRMVFGWKRQLERHLEANPGLKLTAAQAMGMPDDDDD